MVLDFELAGVQIDGARDYQEDAFLITNLTDADGRPSALVIVADGMGGHAAGNVASNMAVQAFNKHISANYPTTNIAEILEQAVIKANNSIKETIAETPALSGMGCTMVAAILEDGNIWWGSVGDSHCYLIRNQELIKKNDDHSYGGFLDRMEAQGVPMEPEPGLARNMLMSALTGKDINEIDISSEPFALEMGDRIILCSDGLDSLSAETILQHSESAESPKEYADALMAAIEEANVPRQDNATAVVVNVKEAVDLTATGMFAATTREADAQLSQPASLQQETTIPDEPKSKTGMMIGIVVAVILAIGGIVAFNMMEMGTQTEPTVADVEMDMEDVEDIETETVADRIDDEAQVEATVVDSAEQATTTKAEKVAPVVATQPEKIVADKIIQDDLKSGGKGPLMVVVPAGKFAMGSTSSRNSNERPRHDVVVEQFAVSQYEITFAQYDLFAKANGRKLPDSLFLDRKTHPVVSVSWDDAYNYTRWLSSETGHKYRLANEAEWEYMASTGKKLPFWWGYDEEPNRAHCFGCGTNLNPRKPTKIGSFEPNAFGIYDTAGNVAEWVHDCWHNNYKGAPEYAEIWEGGDCTFRVVRGGAYSTPAQSIRNAKRDKFRSDKVYDHVGIRVVREIR